MLLISYICSKNQQQVRTKYAQLVQHAPAAYVARIKYKKELNMHRRSKNQQKGRTKYAQLVQHAPVAYVARIKYKKELNMHSC